MMITMIFLVLAGICAGIYFWMRNRRDAVSYYQSHKTRLENRYEESDEALGIRIIEKKSAPPITTSSQSSHTHSACVIALHVMAPENTVFSGYELLQALLSAGLRFGRHTIFHRHEHKDGQGDILFHCASAIAPGTFDLTKMGAFSCRGLSLFFSTSDVAEPLNTLDCLLETVDQLVEDLGGQVLDDKRAPLTPERIRQYREQLRVLENKKTTADLFE